MTTLSSYNSISGNTRIISTSGDTVIQAQTTTPSPAEYNWTFDATGNLTLPGNTFAVNYANGAAVDVGNAGGTTTWALLGDKDGGAGPVTIALGQNAGFDGQANAAISIGQNAGQGGQNEAAIAIGQNAGGNTIQGNNSVAIGTLAGYDIQSINAVAIGNIAGSNTQGESSVAIGYRAGQDNQGILAVAIGAVTGSETQGEEAVAIGYLAGNISQGVAAVAIGSGTGDRLQGNTAVAIGFLAGRDTQGEDAVAIGDNTGRDFQGAGAVAIGGAAAVEDQGGGAVAVGSSAGNFQQGGGAVAVGSGSGGQNQGAGAVAIGPAAALFNQGVAAVSIGVGAGFQTQGNGAIAIGYNAGNNYQVGNAIAIGYSAGLIFQNDSAVAIGREAAITAQGNGAVAIGSLAGNNYQGSNAIAIGTGAGNNTQGNNSVAIGNAAGYGGLAGANYVSGAEFPSTTLVVDDTTGILTGMAISGIGFLTVAAPKVISVTNSTTLEISESAVSTPSGLLFFTGSQGIDAVAIGNGAGQIVQGNTAVAIGNSAGANSQGIAAVAIGASAGRTNQGNNSIILNATGANLDQTTANTFTVAPVRNDVANTGEVVFYNATSKEITYGNTISVAGNITAGNLSAGTVLGNSVTLNTSANVSVAAGQMAWNSADGTMDIGLGYGNVVLQTGQETHYVVRNETGTAISNGTAVYCSGVTPSGRISVDLMTSNISPVQFLGLATQDISNGVNGVVTWFGYVRDLDTRGTANTAISVGDETWAVGDKLYVHPTAAGKLTKVEPAAPNVKICVASIITRNQNSGVLFVRPTTNLTAADLSDVQITTPATNQFLVYVGNRWENTALDISLDTTPALGGNLAGAGFNISNVGNISVTGNISTDGYISAGNIGVSTTITTQTLVTDPGPLSGLTLAFGARGFISDGNLAAAGNFGAQVAGGGGNSVPVWSDGANWYIG